MTLYVSKSFLSEAAWLRSFCFDDDELAGLKLNNVNILIFICHLDNAITIRSALTPLTYFVFVLHNDTSQVNHLLQKKITRYDDKDLYLFIKPHLHISFLQQLLFVLVITRFKL